MNVKHPLIGIVMGSTSDWDTLKYTADILEHLGISTKLSGFCTQNTR